MGGVTLDVPCAPGHPDDSRRLVMSDRLVERVLRLPPATRVYPAHDGDGMADGAIAEGTQYNPRLRVRSGQEDVDLMHGLELGSPRLMDLAVPAVRVCGARPERGAAT